MNVCWVEGVRPASHCSSLRCMWRGLRLVAHRPARAGQRRSLRVDSCRSFDGATTMMAASVKASMRRVRTMHEIRLGKIFIQLAVLLMGTLLLWGGVRAGPPIAKPAQATTGDRAASSTGQQISTQRTKLEEECVAKDGAWRSNYPCTPFGPCPSYHYCELPNPKAGTLCSSSSECGTYLCVPQSANARVRVEGRCDRFSPSNYGCRTTVEEGELEIACTD